MAKITAIEHNAETLDPRHNLVTLGSLGSLDSPDSQRTIKPQDDVDSQTYIDPLNAMTEINVDLAHKVRVAAYCRVSTLAEEQELSFDTQLDYYKTLFENDDRYYLVGVYGDQGITGLQADKRPQFQALMRDCRNGRIDEVYTKSVSRFARNFSECIEYVRELQSLGVVVHFDKENFTTADDNIDMIFSMMAIMAQEEVGSISQAISWSFEQRSKAGDPVMKARYGYRRDRKAIDGIHRWHIQENEAVRVRMVYDLFLEGNSYAAIVRKMNEYEAKRGNKTNWTYAKVQSMLKSEVYVGDILTFKTFTADYLTKTRKVNEGEHDQQYIKDHHPAIITREKDARVKAILERRKRK